MESFCFAKDWLEKLASEAQFFQTKKVPSLDTVNEMLDLLGHPDRSFDYRVVVGGTAGKGTVCRRCEQVLLEEGKTVLTLSSPHLQTPLERIRLNGKLVSRDMFAEGVIKIKEISEQNDIVLTYYEVIVLAGIFIGSQKKCEVLIAEIGLGGEWDAMNAVKGKRISALTFIGEDHLDILGPNLSDVAKTKAGIFTSETVFGVSYEQKHCSIIKKISPIEIHFVKGIKSKLNKKLAQKIVKFVLQKDVVMTPVKIPARWEKIEHIILDGSHSKPRFEFLLPKIKKANIDTAIIAMAKNHDPKSLEIILPHIKNIYWTTVEGDRIFWDSAELQNLLKVGKILDPRDIAGFLETNKEKTLVTGSFYLCGNIRELFYATEGIEESGEEFLLSS